MSGASAKTQLLALCALAAAPLVGGCFMPGYGITYASTAPLSITDSAPRIRDGATTRREALDLLGPPSTVARGREGFVRVGGSSVPTTTLFDPFQAVTTARIAPGDAVYYWAERRVSNTSFRIGGQRFQVDARLWLLVDGTAGVVKAHVVDVYPPPPPAIDDSGSGYDPSPSAPRGVLR